MTILLFMTHFVFSTASASPDFLVSWKEPKVWAQWKKGGERERARFDAGAGAGAGADSGADGAGPATSSPGSDDEMAEIIEAEKADFVMLGQRAWQPPDYSGQEGALGWHADVFKVPKGMEPRVQFWRDIYTKYSTDQGVLHDSLHVGVVYEVLDFRPFMNDSNLTDRQKQKLRRDLVAKRKKEIRERLMRLADAKSPETLEGEDLRIWRLFEPYNESDKFRKALQRKRLRFQLGQSDRFLQGIYYSGRYLKEMEKIFRDRGLPVELTRLPFVESSFNVKARSRVGASGIWQFMRYTGRRFMRVRGAVDERNDPLRATAGAARLFRINFEMLKSWPLAITGYNHGPAGVQRVVKKFNTNDIVELVDERHGRFGFASANFYACFLAALEVEKNAHYYFGDKAHWDTPIESRELVLDGSLSLKPFLKWFSNNTALAKELNLHLQRSFWAGQMRLSAKDFVRVPAHQYEIAMQDLKVLKNAQVSHAVAQVSQPRPEEGLAPDESSRAEYYFIGAGETLSGIALQLGVSVRRLIELNEIENPRRIRAGQKLKVPK